jgi:hypothetical protein
LLGAALLTGACTRGNDGPSATSALGSTTTTAPTTTTTVASAEAIEAFRACMIENEVEIEEIPVDATGRPRLDLVMVTLDFGDPAVAEAVSVCSGHLETGALDLGGEDLLRQAILVHLTDFSRCMVGLGVEGFPDPLPGFIGVGSPFPMAEIPYSDPDFANAVEVCRSVLLDELSDVDEDN